MCAIILNIHTESEMHYLNRTLESTLQNYLKNFPVVGITGPRQSGKSTFIKEMLKNEYKYVSLDEQHILTLFEDDPVKFMEIYNNKIIFDEAQLAPDLFKAIKIAVDNDRNNYGKFVITGSSQFNLVKQISESLAGRIGLLQLLPYQAQEIPESLIKQAVFRGSYPELVGRAYSGSELWYNSYVKTYLERDIRALHNIGDLRDFRRLIYILAANISQQLNIAEISRDLGVNVSTIKRWISVLEASYIIFLLPPYYNNFGKRIVKSPKIYFYDTGLVSFLTGIVNERLYENGPLHGALFENYVISEICKKELHLDKKSELFYFRTNHGEEIDLIIDRKTSQEFFEIKASHTFSPKFTKHLEKYLVNGQSGYILYQGPQLPFKPDLKVLNAFEYLLS